MPNFIQDMRLYYQQTYVGLESKKTDKVFPFICDDFQFDASDGREGYLVVFGRRFYYSTSQKTVLDKNESKRIKCKFQDVWEAFESTFKLAYPETGLYRTKTGTLLLRKRPSRQYRKALNTNNSSIKVFDHASKQKDTYKEFYYLFNKKPFLDIMTILYKLQNGDCFSQPINKKYLLTINNYNMCRELPILLIRFDLVVGGFDENGELLIFNSARIFEEELLEYFPGIRYRADTRTLTGPPPEPSIFTPQPGRFFRVET